MTTTKTNERRILRAAHAILGRRRLLAAVYEHDQWWVTDRLTGAQWSVVDAEGGPSVDGFDFEQVTRGVMTTTTHTPGPLTVHENDTEGVHVVEHYDDPGRYRIVAEHVLPEYARLIVLAPEMVAMIRAMNHMGGDERGGYCICPRRDGSAPDSQHASGCADARALLARLDGKE